MTCSCPPVTVVTNNSVSWSGISSLRRLLTGTGYISQCLGQYCALVFNTAAYFGSVLCPVMGKISQCLGLYCILQLDRSLNVWLSTVSCYCIRISMSVSVLYPIIAYVSDSKQFYRFLPKNSDTSERTTFFKTQKLTSTQVVTKLYNS